MKKIAILIAAILIASGAIICAVGISAHSDSNSDNAEEYILINFDNKNMLLCGTVTLNIIDQSNISGCSGVNRYIASVEMDDNGTFKVGDIGLTKMISGNKIMNAIETEYIGSLKSAAFYEKSGNLLTLKDDAGLPILTFVKMSSDYIGKWNLSSDDSVRLVIDYDGIGGQSQVNVYGGTYRVKESGISINDDIISTLRAGTEEQNKAEHEYYHALADVEGSEVSGSKLILKDSEGKTLLTFVKAELDI